MALVLEIKTTSKKAAAEIKALATKAGASVRTLEKQSVSSSKRMTSSFKGFAGVLGGLGLGLGLAAAVKGFNKVVQAASDTEESLNKVREVFGEAAKSVEVFSETAAESLGASTQAALAMTGEIGNLLVAMKFSEDAAAGFSIEMVQLAADLGSFNNVPTVDALNAIRSALVGETEPMRRFGSTVSVARLEQLAFAEGIEFTKGKMSAQTKALLAMKAITIDTKKAQGDFRRTSEGLANSQKILAANFDDLQASLGRKLIPTMKTVTNLVNEMVTSFTKTDFDKAIDKLKEMGDTKDFVKMLELNRAIREEAKKRSELTEKILKFQREQIIIADRRTGKIEKAGTALENELDSIIKITKFTRDTANLQEFIKNIEEKRLSNQKSIAATLDAGLDKTTGLLDRLQTIELSLLNTSTSAAEFLSLLNEEKTITGAIKSLLDGHVEAGTNLVDLEAQQIEALEKRRKQSLILLNVEKSIAKALMENAEQSKFIADLQKERLDSNPEFIEFQEKIIELKKIDVGESEKSLQLQILITAELSKAAGILNEIALLATKKKKFSLSSILGIAAGITKFIPGAQGISAGLTAGSILTRGFQGGGSFIVPGTGSGDRPTTLNLAPGEQVDITPRNQVTNNKNITMHNTFIFQVADEITVKTKLIPILNDWVERQGGKLVASKVA